MLDMGAYYVGNLVQLIGPVQRLMAMSSMPFSTRTISSEPRNGEHVSVDVATSIHTMLEFHNGAQITLSLSWDVWQHEHNNIELYGTDATLHVIDVMTSAIRSSDSQASVTLETTCERPAALTADLAAQLLQHAR